MKAKSKDKTEQPKFLEDIFPAELEEIKQRRNNHHLDPSKIDDAIKTKQEPSVDLGVIGLALSGGGIRSATFSLGVVQGLIKKKVFKVVDYLSTVSGGGFLGSCISSLLNKDVSKETGEKNAGIEDKAVRHLRNSSNYLAPPGLQNILRLPTIVIRGIFLNLMLFLPYIIAAVFITEVTNEMVYGYFIGGSRYIFYSFLIITVLLLALYPFLSKLIQFNWKWRNLNDMLLTYSVLFTLLAFILHPIIKQVLQFVNYGFPYFIQHFYSQSDIWWGVIVLLCIALILFIPLEFLKGIKPKLVNLLIATLGPLIIFSIFLAMCVFFIESPFILTKHGQFLHAMHDAEQMVDGPKKTKYLKRVKNREDYADFLDMLVNLKLVPQRPADISVQHAPVSWKIQADDQEPFEVDIQDKKYKPYRRLLYAISNCRTKEEFLPIRNTKFCSQFIMLLMKEKKLKQFPIRLRINERPNWKVNIISTRLPDFFSDKPGIEPLLNAVSTSNQEKLQELKSEYKNFIQDLIIKGLIQQEPLRLTAIKTGEKLWDIEVKSKEIGISDYGLYMRIHEGSIIQHLSWKLYLVAIVMMLINFFFLDVNTISHHAFYRDRISKAFIIRKGKEGEINSEADPRLTELNTPGSLAPYHLINTALNVPKSINPDLRGRNADFFTFSKHYCGSELTGYCNTADMEEADQHIKLCTAIAVSGGAASPSMGTMKLAYLRVLLTLLNIRMNYWVPNPRNINKEKIRAKKLNTLKKIRMVYTGPKYLFKEAMGSMDEKSAKVNLSDGGHIENLAIYQLLKRRCKLIIAVDGEADKKMKFKGLITLLRYAEIDMDININIHLDGIRIDDNKISPNHWALGKINYPSDEGTPETGLLLYIKSSLTGDENECIKAYCEEHPDFPHQSTADQFFSENQFEAYRALGEKISNEIFSQSRFEEEAAELLGEAGWKSLKESLYPTYTTS